MENKGQMKSNISSLLSISERVTTDVYGRLDHDFYTNFIALTEHLFVVGEEQVPWEGFFLFFN